MIAVIFEAWPFEKQKQQYFDIAAALRPILEKMPGFISIERFQSIQDPGKILSLSFWQDDQSVRQWRNLEQHRLAQARGREIVFKDYRLRIGDISRDYGKNDRRQAPADSREFHPDSPQGK